MPKKRRSVPLPIITFLSGLCIGVNAGRSWLGFLSVMTGFALAFVGALVWIRFERRKKLRQGKPLLERLLDEMIKTVENAGAPLETFVVFNARRQDSYRSLHHLQVRGAPGPSGSCLTYDLAAETVTIGKYAGWIQAKITTYLGTSHQEGVVYPDYGSWAKPDPWLADRLKKLSALVGDVSLYEKRKRRLKDLGVDIEKDRGSIVDPFEPPPAA